MREGTGTLSTKFNTLYTIYNTSISSNCSKPYGWVHCTYSEISTYGSFPANSLPMNDINN